VHTSVAALEADIRQWIDAWNENPRLFTWTKTADEILNSLENIWRELRRRTLGAAVSAYSSSKISGTSSNKITRWPSHITTPRSNRWNSYTRCVGRSCFYDLPAQDLRYRLVPYLDVPLTHDQTTTLGGASRAGPGDVSAVTAPKLPGSN
jgi:hypothetical protein